MSFGRYPKYKDSGVEWLGEVPEHWDVVPLKRLATFTNGSAFKPTEWAESGYPIIRIENLNGSDNFNYFDGDADERHLIHDGDLLFGWSGNRGTSFGPYRWSRREVCVLNQHIFKVESDRAGIDPLYWTLKAVTTHVEDQAHGIIGMVHITKGDLGAINVPVASPVEQNAIAAFLDRETGKIDALIAEQRRLIELLQEKRQAVISHAVTKGLNPDAPMKDSGIEWLGMVPAHWELKPLRHACDVHNTLRTPIDQQTRLDLDGEFAYYGPTGVLSWINRYVVEGEFFLIGEDGDHFLKYQTQSMTVNVSGRFNVNNHAHLVSGKANCSTQWASLFFEHKDLLPWLIKQGVGRYKLRKEALLTIPMLVPPKDEQDRILMSMSRVKNVLNALVNEVTETIALLQERRSALISAAVTGQIDVRGLASSEVA